MNVSIPEKELWEGLSQKNEDTFNYVYTTHYQALYRYGRKITHDDALVKDGIQELFLSLYRRETPFNSHQPIKFFLLTALRNKLIDSLGKHSISVTLLPTEELSEATTDSGLDQIIRIESEKEITEKLHKALAQLTERQREALHLRYFEDLSPQQIADIMHMNYQSVLNLIQRGLHRLSGLVQFLVVVASISLYSLFFPLPRRAVSSLIGRWSRRLW